MVVAHERGYILIFTKYLATDSGDDFVQSTVGIDFRERTRSQHWSNLKSGRGGEVEIMLPWKLRGRKVEINWEEIARGSEGPHQHGRDLNAPGSWRLQDRSPLNVCYYFGEKEATESGMLLTWEPG